MVWRAYAFSKGNVMWALLYPIAPLWTICAAAQAFVETRPPLLTTARAVHSLSAAEGNRRYPVRIRGWVAYYDPYADPNQSFMFLHDQTGDIFVSLPKLPVLAVRQGTPVEVTGIGDPGEFAPIIAHGQVRELEGPVRRLDAPEVELPLLLLGDYDARFATITGVVQAVFGSDKNMVFKLSTGSGVLRATTVREPGVDYARLIDAQIKLRANIGPQFNPRRQVTGVHLFFESMEDVQIVRSPPENPFASPPRPIDELIKTASGLGVLNSIHIQGQTTLYWPGRLLCLQDRTGGLCVESRQRDVVVPGETVGVVGFPRMENTIAGLIEARFERLGTGRPTPAVKTTPGELLRGGRAGELVTIEAKLIGADQDHSGDALTGAVLTMESDGKIFPAILPSEVRRLDSHAKEKGSVLRLTGVCLPELDRLHREIEEREPGYDSFRLLLRSPEDVEVIETPSWWNGPHVLYVLLAGAGVAVAGTIWVIVLRRRVRQQTSVIRESEERFRHLAEHDGLTGLANRRLLHERLEAAVMEARTYGSTFAVLMMDLDKFKQVNDNFGHPAGDAMLRAAAERISRSVRQGDTVARMGGDEFVVLLPVLHDAEEAAAAAARIVAAIAEPLIFEGSCVPMSASIGVCIYPNGGSTPDELLGNCDLALYKAKERGRNCWQAFSAERMSKMAETALC